jgi:hypothetical protein
MPAADPLTGALTLAAEQIARLRADDFDAYLAALPVYEAACAEAAALFTSANPSDANRLNELIELQRQIAAHIDASRAQLGRRMSSLRASRRANGAYLAQVAIPQQPIGQA